MISVGASAPDFIAKDQNGRPWRLRDHLQECVNGVCNRRNVLVLFYPRDWTPTCSGEVPALDRAAQRFLDEANTVVVAMNANSHQSHQWWCQSLGGVAMPVLADDYPYGRISKAYGAWIPGGDVSDRATVIVGPSGNVLYAQSVGEFGKRSAWDLLDIAKRVTGNATRPGPALAAVPIAPAGVPMLFLSPGCGACEQVKAYLRRTKPPTSQLMLVDSTSVAGRALIAQYRIEGTPALVMNGQQHLGPTKVIAQLRPLFGA